MTQQLQKAYLETETGSRIDCMFNPTTFAFSTSNRWESDQIPGKDTPTLRYAGGAGGSFNLSLVFDTTDSGFHQIYISEYSRVFAGTVAVR